MDVTAICSKPLEWERHTTRENILKFFDPATYAIHHTPPCSTWAQKRPAETTPVAAVAKQRAHPSTGGRMGKEELVEKFKLAATLNGVSWAELCDPWLLKIFNEFTICCVVKFSSHWTSSKSPNTIDKLNIDR